MNAKIINFGRGMIRWIGFGTPVIDLAIRLYVGKVFFMSGLTKIASWSSTLALFDFPNPNATAEKRLATITPPQQLYFLNGDFVWDRARALAGRIAGEGPDDAAKIRAAYRRVFGRDPRPAELKLGLEFVRKGAERWTQYARALLNSNEFLFVN